MKRTAALLTLGLALQASAWADTVIYTRTTSFPKFGTAKTVFTIDSTGPYRHSKTVLENRYRAPATEQVGYQQRLRYRRGACYDRYKMIMWH